MGKSCFDGYLTPDCASCCDWSDGSDGRGIGCNTSMPIMWCKPFAKMFNEREEHKGEYRTVRDLTAEELDELRAAYYEQCEQDGVTSVEGYEAITDEILFNHYDGVSFVREDFLCNMAEESEANS